MGRISFLLVSAALFASCASSPERGAAGSASRLAFQAGYRSFEDGDIWEPVDAEVAIGIEYTRVSEAAGIGFDIGVLGSIGLDDGLSSGVDVTGAAAEVYSGLRLEFPGESFRPYIGGGGTLIFAGVDNDAGGLVADDQDTSAGYYLRAGAVIPLTKRTFMAFDARYVGGTSIEFETISGDADYVQALVQLGLRL